VPTAAEGRLNACLMAVTGFQEISWFTV